MPEHAAQNTPPHAATAERGKAPSTLAYFLPLYVLACITIVLTLYFLDKSESDNCYGRMQFDEVRKISIQHSAISRTFRMLVSDLQFLSTHRDTRRTLLAENETDYGAGRTGAEELFLSFAAARHAYDQLRLLDSDGNEVVRINYNDNSPFVVDKGRLQNKKDRYYFSRTMAMNAGDFYVSPLDLNIENNEVERPFKPMLRLATPIADNDNAPLGILVANYLAGRLLQSITNLDRNSFSESILLNAEGYWLISGDVERNWGFMLPDRSHLTFENEYPEEWGRMAGRKDGQFRTGNGIYTFTTIYPALETRNAILDQGSGPDTAKVDCQEGEDTRWILISHVPAEEANQCSRVNSTPHLIVGLGLFLAAGFGCWFVASTVARRVALQRKLAVMAQFDALTGLPNRVLFGDRLATALRNAERESRKCGLLYIDLDNFKSVNDTFGHKEGDRVLVRVAAILAESTRKSDTVARLGGDEFAAILNNVASAQDAVRVGDKMIRSICDDPVLDFGTFKVGASIGVAMYPDDAPDLEQLMKAADEAMYTAKQGGKNRCFVHGSDE